MMQLEEQRPKKPTIIIWGGCGHIGLPLCVRLTLAGWSVVAVETSESRVSSVNKGQFPFKELHGEELLAEALATGRFRATTDATFCCGSAPVVIVTIGMDLDKYNNPKLQEFLDAFAHIVRSTPEDAFYVMRSTLYPGSMKLLEEHLAKLSLHGKTFGKLAYCPERTAEMHALEEIVQLPQLISACDQEAFEKANEVFRTLAPSLVRLTNEEAEFAKLMTNAWRYLEFAIGNQFYTLLQNSGVDFFKVMNAVTYGYPRARNFKKPGFCAGPCLLKDTQMLIRHSQHGFPMGSAAVNVNETLAEAVVRSLSRAFSQSSGNSSISGRTIGLLGMAFKANVDDFRQSLSFRVRKVCRLQGATVLHHDLFLPEDQEKGSVSLEALVELSEGIILCTPHESYQHLNFTKLGKTPPVIVDVWNFLPSLGCCGIGANNPELFSGTMPVIPSLPPAQLREEEAKDKPTVMVTGSSGFIGGYLVQELLQHGYRVLGVDNFSKYGRVERAHDNNPDYELHEGDAKDVSLLRSLAERCDYIVACAAMIGGISYFHSLAYDLLAENERIIASTFDAAIHAFKGTTKKGEVESKSRLKKIIVLSSSMVFERSNTFPTPEGEQEKCPPPSSTYGFQKLACEYYAKGAWEQYQLPFTIIQPFNCVGIGEHRSLRGCGAGAANLEVIDKEKGVVSGNIKLAMSHVEPDLIQKLLKGQDPLHILGDGKQVRHYTYGGDLARGIRMCIESPSAINNDFNISTETSTTVLELAELVWKKIHGDSKPFRWVSDPPFCYDVQLRIPGCKKAKDLLGFQATTTLSETLDEIIPWIQQEINSGDM